MERIFGQDISVASPIFAGLVHEAPEPGLRIDGLGVGGAERETLSLTGLTVNLARLKGRRCTGYFDLADYSAFPCPELAKLELASGTQCPACFRRSGFNPAFYNAPADSLSPQQRAYNARPHVVYLAGFDELLLKVGISSNDRAANRLREQGALSAYVIAQCDDAGAARDIESAIVADGCIKEAVSGAKKRSALIEGASPSAIDTALAAECYRLIGEGLIDGSIPAVTWRDQLESNRAAAVLAKGAFDHSDAQPLAIAGTISGSVGSLLIVECDRGKRLIVDSKKFLGHRIGYAEKTLGDLKSAQSRLL
jgi:Protein of unknown function (DUF2797)